MGEHYPINRHLAVFSLFVFFSISIMYRLLYLAVATMTVQRASPQQGMPGIQGMPNLQDMVPGEGGGMPNIKDLIPGGDGDMLPGKGGGIPDIKDFIPGGGMPNKQGIIPGGGGGMLPGKGGSMPSLQNILSGVGGGMKGRPKCGHCTEKLNFCFVCPQLKEALKQQATDVD